MTKWPLLVLLCCACSAPAPEASPVDAAPAPAPAPQTPHRFTRVSGAHYSEPLIRCEPTRGDPTAGAQIKALLAKHPKVGQAGVIVVDPATGVWAGANQLKRFEPGTLNALAWFLAALASDEDAPGTVEPEDWEAIAAWTAGRAPEDTRGLRQRIGPDAFDRVARALALKEDRLDQPWVSARAAARMFQLLYDATFVSTEASDNALVGLRRGGVIQVESRAPGHHHRCELRTRKFGPRLVCVLTEGGEAPALAELVESATGELSRVQLPAPTTYRVERLERPRVARPLHRCDDVGPNPLADVGDAMEAEIDRLRAAGFVTTASAHVRDLNRGEGVGAHDDLRYSPASLNKVLWLLVLLKRAQREPDILRQKVIYPMTVSPAEHQNFWPETGLARSQLHPLIDIAEAMIVESDNDAMRSVYGAMGMMQGLDTYEDLGFGEMTVLSAQLITDRMTPEMFNQVLQVLYDATYLNRRMSERALDMMARVKFPRGIRLAVPRLPLAHKFGEYFNVEEYGPTLQFHHCGIIYFPERPFALCIMTRGLDFWELVDAVEDIAEVAYEQLQAVIQAPAER